LILDGVAHDREEVIIKGREPVVMVSLEDYESLRETPRARTPSGGRRLTAGS
jgi:antitoxin YefM